MAAKITYIPQCPFFSEKIGHGIQCSEGLVDSDIRVRFNGIKPFTEHYRSRCCERYTLCPIYRLILQERYEEAYQDYLNKFQR